MAEAGTADAAARGIELVTIIEADATAAMGGRLIADALGQVIENAISFSPSQGLVRVRLGHSFGRVTISVEDQGPGVPPERLPHIFERHATFRDNAARQDSAGVEPEQNFGLGLWVAKRNLEALGGSISAANKPEGGFMVTLLLPIAAR